MKRSRRRLGFEYNPYVIGGTETFLRLLFLHLDPERYVPVVIAASAGRWQGFLDGIAETAVVPYATPDGAPADIAAALRDLDLDLLQSSYFSPAVAFAATKMGLPNVWRIGGHVDAIERQWQANEKSHLLHLVCMLSRRIVCGSEFLRSQFPPAERSQVEVIRNGIDLGARPLPGPVSSAPAIAMVAHLVPQKRHEVFLRAAAAVAARSPAARFFIFGGSYELANPELVAYERSLRLLVAELGLESRLEIRELHTDRFATMAEIDVFAFPGVNEGASNAIVEAMALAKPVVAAASGGNPELIEDRVTGRLVAADEPEALADAILELVEDSSLRARIGNAARLYVEHTHDIRGCACRYESLYEEVLGEPRR